MSTSVRCLLTSLPPSVSLLAVPLTTHPPSPACSALSLKAMQIDQTLLASG